MRFYTIRVLRMLSVPGLHLLHALLLGRAEPMPNQHRQLRNAGEPRSDAGLLRPSLCATAAVAAGATGAAAVLPWLPVSTIDPPIASLPTSPTSAPSATCNATSRVVPARGGLRSGVDDLGFAALLPNYCVSSGCERMLGVVTSEL